MRAVYNRRVARVDLPQSRLKIRRRRRRQRIALAFGVLAVALCAGVVGLAYIPAIRISAVSVRGAQTLASSSVIAQVRGILAGRYALIIPKDNIFLYSQHTLEGALRASYPQLQSVEVHAVDFHTIEVSLTTPITEEASV